MRVDFKFVGNNPENRNRRKNTEFRRNMILLVDFGRKKHNFLAWSKNFFCFYKIHIIRN